MKGKMMEDNILKSYTGIYVFEGIDNVGKSTIVQNLKTKICETTDYDCINIAFPGNEPRTLGSLVYDIHHHNNKYFDMSINDASLQLMHVASHIDLIQRKLVGECSSSSIILMDRFWWSTYAYGLAGELEKDVIHSIIAPELIYWEKINIKKIFLLERENRAKEYETKKDEAIIQNYRELAKGNPKCRIVSNNCNLEETVTKIYDSILGG